MQSSATRDISKYAKHRQGKSSLRQVTAEFAAKERPTRREIGAYKEMFYTLALKAGKDDIRALSVLLSKADYAPRPIVMFFAMHEIAAATPMLRHSKVLDERDLVSLVLKLDVSHALQIAQREDLTLEVVNALLARDNANRSILKRLLKNTHVNASDGIANVLKKAERESPFKTSNAGQTVSAGSTGPLLPLADNVQTDLSGALLSLASKGGKLGKSDLQARGSRDGNNTLSSELHSQLLRISVQHNHEAFAYCVFERCSLPLEVTRKALERKDAGFLATLLRAFNVPRNSTSRILLLLAPQVGRNLEIFGKVLERWDAMHRDDCVIYLEALGADFSKDSEMSKFSRIASKRKRELSVPARPSTKPNPEHSVSPVAASA